MTDKLRILVVEDVEDDARLAERTLRDGGLDFEAHRVETRDAFCTALAEWRPGVILVDIGLPEFDGRTALALAKQRLPLVPVIVVTGTLPDESAVELLREGASDYILKDRLSRLPDAVRRALGTARLEGARREAEERYRALFSEAHDGIALVDAETGRPVDCNREFEAQTGRPLEELRRIAIWELGPPELVLAARRTFGQVLERGDGGSAELEFRRPDGGTLAVEFRSRVLELHGKRYVQIISRDVSERLAAERAMREQLDELRRFQEVAVDRELNMEELRATVEELQAQIAHVKGSEAVHGP